MKSRHLVLVVSNKAIDRADANGAARADADKGKPLQAAIDGMDDQKFRSLLLAAMRGGFLERQLSAEDRIVFNFLTYVTRSVRGKLRA